jgi:SET domain-containing protein
VSDLVEARSSEIHGTGVFATTAIAGGSLIGTYEGDPTDVDGTHVLWIEDDERGSWSGIDGTGVLRFLNHSRTPNVEFDGPELYAVRDIAPGEELLFDYGEEWSHIP